MKKFPLLAAGLLAFAGMSYAQEATPAQMADAEMEGLGAWLNSSDAQAQQLELMQQGKYVRKSLMIVPTLMWMGDGYDQVRLRHRPEMIRAVRDSLMHMSRFDINPISKRSYNGFRNAWFEQYGEAKSPAKREKLLAQLIQETLTPDLLGAMTSMMKDRAANNVSEADQNSFMVDKAKESGVSASELNLVLNSGYVVVPTVYFVAFGYDDKNQIQATVKGGLNLYRVVVNADVATLELRKSIVRMGSYTMDAKGYDPVLKAMLPADWRSLNDEDLSMAFALDQMYNSAMQDMRDLKEFRLLSQMTSTEGSTYQAPFGAGEIKEVVMDKFFEQVEQVEKKDGSIGDEVTGWGFMKKPVNFKVPVKIDSNTTEYIWEGYAAKGDIMSGIVVREYSRLPVDVDFVVGFSTMGLEIPETSTLFSATDKDGLAIVNPASIQGSGLMAQITSQLSLAPYTGISQLMLRASVTYKGTILSDGTVDFSNVPMDALLQADGSLGIGKKWWLGRFVPGVFAEGFYGMVQLSGTDDAGNTLSVKDDVFGARAGIDMEFAASPNLRFGVRAAGAAEINGGAWKYNLNDAGDVDVVDPFGGELPTLSPLSIEAGAYVTFNLWPLRKAWDAVMQSSTEGLAGAVMQANLRTIQ